MINENIQRHARRTFAVFAAYLLLLASPPAISHQFDGLFMSSNQWYLAAIPDIRSSMSLDRISIDGMSDEDYGQKWVIFRFDDNAQKYVQADRAARLSSGEGFWVIQAGAADAWLRYDYSGPGTTLAPSDPRCSIAGGCNELSLRAGAAADDRVVWSMVGHPSPNVLNANPVYVEAGTSTLPCGKTCELRNHIASGKLSALFVYAGPETGYQAIDNPALLRPWQGAWLGRRGSTGNVSMFFPNFEEADSGSLEEASTMATEQSRQDLADSVRVVVDAIERGDDLSSSDLNGNGLTDDVDALFYQTSVFFSERSVPRAQLSALVALIETAVATPNAISERDIHCAYLAVQGAAPDAPELEMIYETVLSEGSSRAAYFNNLRSGEVSVGNERCD